MAIRFLLNPAWAMLIIKEEPYAETHQSLRRCASASGCYADSWLHRSISTLPGGPGRPQGADPIRLNRPRLLSTESTGELQASADPNATAAAKRKKDGKNSTSSTSWRKALGTAS